VAAGLALVLVACGGGGGSGSVGAIVAAPGGDTLVSLDPNPIIARNSPVLAVNPTQSTNMVVVDRVDRPDYGLGVHVTNNSGANWQDMTLPRPPGSTGKPYAPAAAYDTRGLLYVTFVTLIGNGNDPEALWVTRSGDGGLTFDEPSRVAGDFAYQATLATGPRGRLYVAWVQSSLEGSACILCFTKTGLPIMFSRSDDGGKTWTAPVQVSDQGRARIGAPALAVDGEGNPSVLYVDYGADRFDWENLPGRYEGTFSLVLARSNDRGTSFEPGKVVDDAVVPTGRFSIYLPPAPAFAIARKGDMVAAWADGRSGDADILLRRSTDVGATWSGPVRVNRGTPGDGVPQDLPAVGVAPGGRIDVAYYDRTVDARGPMADVLLSSSSNGGKSFAKTVRLTTQPSNRKIGPEGSPHSPEADFGSRISIASLAGGAIVTWTDTRTGTPDSGKQDVFTGQTPLKDNESLGLGFLLLAGGGLVLGVAGVTLFVMSRRARRARGVIGATEG
jgi:hypothetical protein